MNRKRLTRAAVIIFSLGAFAAVAPMPAAAQSPMAQKILGPHTPADASASSSAPKKVAMRKDASAQPVRYSKGSIVGLRAGTLVLAVGKKIVDIALGPGTVVKTAKGRIVALSSLRKGEHVKVSYRSRGAHPGAASISIVS